MEFLKYEVSFPGSQGPDGRGMDLCRDVRLCLRVRHRLRGWCLRCHRCQWGPVPLHRHRCNQSRRRRTRRRTFRDQVPEFQARGVEQNSAAVAPRLVRPCLVLGICAIIGIVESVPMNIGLVRVWLLASEMSPPLSRSHVLRSSLFLHRTARTWDQGPSTHSCGGSTVEGCTRSLASPTHGPTRRPHG